MAFKAHSLGSEVDAAVIQTDHADYRSLSATELPGAKVLVDGRNIVTQAWDGLVLVTLGRA